MKKGLVSIFLSVLAVIIPVYLFYTILMYSGYRPLLTNSISFDAKIRYIQQKKITQIDLMAIGSSMTLNNLSSNVIMDSIKYSYFNFASWGLQMSDDKIMLANYLFKYKPRYVMICSNVLDFILDGNGLKIGSYLRTPEFIKHYQEQYFYIKNYNSMGDIIERKKETDHLESVTNEYRSLKFDRGGAALINVPRNKITELRWNQQNAFPTQYSDYQYQQLTLVCQLLYRQHVSLIYIQTPIKSSYVGTVKSRQIIDAHVLKCKTIVEKYGGTYLNINYDKRLSDDKMFVDQFHLSEIGATLFTQDIIHDLKKAINYNARSSF